jgi:hypothetical protein
VRIADDPEYLRAARARAGEPPDPRARDVPRLRRLAHAGEGIVIARVREEGLVDWPHGRNAVPCSLGALPQWEA